MSSWTCTMKELSVLVEVALVPPDMWMWCSLLARICVMISLRPDVILVLFLLSRIACRAEGVSRGVRGHHFEGEFLGHSECGRWF